MDMDNILGIDCFLGVGWAEEDNEGKTGASVIK